MSPPSFTVTLGPEQLFPYPSPHPYQSPDSAFAVLEDNGPASLMFWTDGSTYRVVGPPTTPGINAMPSATAPSPLTPVLTGDTSNNASYDYNGNWLLSAHRLPNSTIVGFTHTENHNFPCGGGYAEWNYGAVVASDDDGVTWRRLGLAIEDPQPCKAAFGGSGYSSVLPHPDGGFLGYGGCSAYRSLSPEGLPGTWLRYYEGNFSQPGTGGGLQTCIPGVPGNACCPIAHYNAFVGAFVMIYTTWGTNDTLYIAASEDGIEYGPSALLYKAEGGRAIAYGQVIGATNSSAVGAGAATATLVYAAAPPVSGFPRDFVYRNITFAVQEEEEEEEEEGGEDGEDGGGGRLRVEVGGRGKGKGKGLR
jgi:hypothetical protein